MTEVIGITLFVAFIWYFIRLHTGEYIAYTSDCELECCTVWGNGRMERDMEKTLRCKDCSAKLRQTLEATREAVGGSGASFEIIKEKL